MARTILPLLGSFHNLFCYNGAMKHLLLIGSGSYGEFIQNAAQDLECEFSVLDGRDLPNLAEHPATHVVIATPNDTHKTIAAQALRAGKHVLCEKPLALSVEDVRELFSLARANGVSLLVGFVLTNHPFYMYLKKLQKQYGPIRAFEVVNNATEGMLQPEWYWDRERSGGWFMIAEIHWYHLFAWLTDAREHRVEQAGEVSFSGRDIATYSVVTSPAGQKLIVDHRLDATYDTAYTKVDVVFPDARMTLDDWVPRSLQLPSAESAHLCHSELVSESMSDTFVVENSVVRDTRHRDVIYASLVQANLERLLSGSADDESLITEAHRVALAAQQVADSDD